MNFAEIAQLNEVSLNNGGTLHFSFLQLLDILLKDGIKATDIFVEKIYNQNEICGYCLFYLLSSGTIKIAQICVAETFQRKGIGHSLIQKLKNQYHNILADVYFSNYKSHNFFIKEGFDFVEDPRKEKERWNIKWDSKKEIKMFDDFDTETQVEELIGEEWYADLGDE